VTVPVGSVPRWPTLPPALKDLLSSIEGETEDVARHPRPWDLASLPDAYREVVWAWLSEAVTWLNASYAWQPETVIPPCWREHPHLALELAVLAFGRELAYRSTRTREPGEWHDDLSEGWKRMVAAVGELEMTECQRGTHRDRPAAYELERNRHWTVAPASGR
jgi:hypothetical protein